MKGDGPASELTALVALVRRAAGIDKRLTRHSERVRRAFQEWVLRRHAGAGQKFNEEQMQWLHMIRNHLATSFHIAPDDLELAPFDAHGGLGRMYQLFGEEMETVMDELNAAVSA